MSGSFPPPCATTAAANVSVLSIPVVFLVRWNFFGDCDGWHHKAIPAMREEAGLFRRSFEHLSRAVFRLFGHTQTDHVA